MSGVDEQLWEVFVAEAGEGLDQLAELVDVIELADGDVSEAVRTAFRIAHNIKGASRLTGVVAVERLTHVLEDVLSNHVQARTVPAGPFISLLRMSIVGMQRFVQGTSEDEPLLLLAAEVEAFVGMGLDRPSAASVDTAGDRESEEASEASEYVRALAPEPSAASSDERNPESLTRKDVPADGPAGDRTRTVRVDTARLDRLLGFAGEFLGTHGRLRSRVSGLESLLQDFVDVEKRLPVESRKAMRAPIAALTELVREEHRAVQQFGYLASDFGDAIKRVRMHPVSGLVPSWRHLVMDAASGLGKRVRFMADVGDSEIDREVLDLLRDPMTHILRNAVDHGLEDAEARAAVGKDPTGVVRIEARGARAAVIIEIHDDGRGLDIERIRGKAVERALLDEEAARTASAEEVAQLVFEEGLSTARKVSNFSGRGIGLDVVRRRVQELGGQVQFVEPAKLGGTSIRLQVPVSLVSTRGLLLRTDEGQYVVPADSLTRTLRVPVEELVETDGGTALVRKGEEPIRLAWLASLMGEQRKPDPDKLPVAVVNSGSSTLGLVVRGVVGEVEYVSKRLPWNLEEVPGIAGAVILGDGDVAPVLDVAALCSGHGRAAPTDKLRREESKAKPRVLVADDSLTSRTLERNILTAAGYDVRTVVNGMAAWEALQEESFALLVSDVEMPELTGLELTRRVRADGRFEHLPIILVTSLDDPSQIAEGAAAGANEYIVKGRFDQRVLLEAVARLL